MSALPPVLTMHCESLALFRPEYEARMREHWEQLALNRDRVALDPIWKAYERMEAEGRLFIMAARKNGALAGYFVGFLGPHLHYAQLFQLHCDVFYVYPEYRRGTLGVRLFRTVEIEARRRGVRQILCATKLHDDSSALLRRLGYRAIETNHALWIGDD